MGRADSYRQMLQGLLPPGEAWTREADSILGRVLAAAGDGLARAHGRALDLLDERDPRSTTELLTDWERVAGLPDECAPDDLTTAERREQLHSRLAGTGGQTVAYLKSVAADLGFDVEIRDDFPVATARSLKAGDALYGPAWGYALRVTAPSQSIRVFQAGRNAAGDPLRVWGREALMECVIRRDAPAHSPLYFQYEG